MAKEVAKDDVINATIAALAFVKKPKPAAKYLGTPPFRYIYDLVIAVVNETGFPRGLFSAEQMAFPANVAKEQKVAFLDRLITCLNVATGSALEARPQKICAGMEPDKTNVMLQELGKCAQNTTLNLADILARVNAQIGPPDGAAPAAGAGEGKAADDGAAAAASAAAAKAKEEATAAAAAAEREREKKQREADAEAARKEEEKKKARAEAIAKAQAAAAAAEAKAAAEREEAERKAQAAAASAQAAASQNAPAPAEGGLRFDGEQIALQEPGAGEAYVDQTIKLYANLISKPKMAAKLLERPPFRFIQDVVIAVHQRTAFGTGVFTEHDLTSDKDNKTESKQKLAYLQRLIDVVGLARSRDLKGDVNPRKVAAGQDADKTNLLLQELARAAASGVNADDLARLYNQRQNGGGDDTAATDDGAAAAKAAADAQAKAAADERAAAAAAKAEADAAKKREAEATLAAAKKKIADEKRRAEADAEEQRKKAAEGDMPRLPLGALNDGKGGAPAGGDSEAGADAPGGAGGAGGDGAPKRAERPRTARRAPPRVKEAHLIDDSKKAANTALPDEAKDAGGAGGDAKANAGSNAANGGAGAGASAVAAAGVIKEDDKGAAEEPDSEPDEAEQPLWKQDAKAGGAADNKDAGKLLSAILKAQDNGDGKAGGMRVPTAKGAAAQSKLMSTEQLQALRAAVQKVCQSANPLGKCIDFVYEDMDGMQKELARWKRAYSQYNEKFEEEKQQTQAVLAPLQAQIKAADAALAAQMRKIHTLKASILRNDQIIASAIEQHATSV